MENNLISIKYLSRISTRLMLGSLTSLMFFPANKALAIHPSANMSTWNLSVDYNQCMNRANEAANLILSDVSEISESPNRHMLFGNTTVTRTTIMCIKKEKGSTLVIVSSGSNWRGAGEEAKSVFNRFNEVLSTSL